jgi:ribosomal protein L31
MASLLGLIVVNQGDTPTFEHANQASHIDVTFASSFLIRKISDWQVLVVDITSDHHPIYFSIQRTIPLACSEVTDWSWRRTDNEKLVDYLKSYTTLEGQVVFDDMVLGKFLEAVCDSCMPRRGVDHMKPVHW